MLLKLNICDVFILDFQVWSISCMVYYAQQMCAGRSLPTPYENIHDDPNQVC